MRLPHNPVDMIFHQRGSGYQTCPPIASSDEILHRDIIYCNCDTLGHYYGQCHSPDGHRTDTQSLKLGYSFAHTTPVHKYLINNNCILIESCSTMSSFMNPYLLSDIDYYNPDMYICVFTGGGNLDYKKSVTMYLLPLRFSTIHIPLTTSWNSLMLPVSSELPWIPTTNPSCLSTLDQDTRK